MKMSAEGSDSWALRILIASIVIFLVFPVVISVPMSFSAAKFISFPPEGLTLHWYVNFFTNREWMNSFGISLILATSSAVISIAIGTGMAYAIDRHKFPGKQLLNSFIMLPLVVPGVITGVAVLAFYILIGVGITLLGLIIAHVTFCTAYVVKTVGSSLAKFDINIEQAAEVLGASKARAIWEITIPVIKTGIVAGGLLAWMESFNDFTIAFFISKAGMQPLQVLLYSYIKFNPDPTIAVASVIQVLVTMLAIIAVNKLAGLQSVMTL